MLALWSCGPVPAEEAEEGAEEVAEDESLKLAQVGCCKVKVVEARRVHRNLADLLCVVPSPPSCSLCANRCAKWCALAARG